MLANAIRVLLPDGIVGAGNGSVKELNLRNYVIGANDGREMAQIVIWK